MDEGFAMLRSERRSFFCPNKLWRELIECNSRDISVGLQRLFLPTK